MESVPAQQSRTILGPLTTTFTPRPACTQVATSCDTCLLGWQAQTCSGVGDSPASVQDDPSCWPPLSGEAAALQFTLPLLGYGFYSPGLICPSGYTSACSATAGGASDWHVEYSMVAGETAVGCCPTGYFCAYTTEFGDLEWQSCRKIASKTIFGLAKCGDTNDPSPSLTLPATITATVTEGDASFPTTTTIDTLSLWAPLVQINWQATDLARVTSTSALTTTSRSQPSSTPTSPASASLASAGQNLTSHSGLATGAKVGIGVAVSATVIVIGLVSWLLYRNRMQREFLHISKTDQSLPHELSSIGKPVIYEAAQPTSELSAGDRTYAHELST